MVLILLPRKKWLMDLMNILPILVLTWQVPSITLHSFRLFVKPAKSKLDRFKLVSVSRVIKLLNGLSNCKPTGLDKISGRILRVATNSIAPSLTHIFNYGLILNCFPDEWKMAQLVPIHKKGPRDLIGNYINLACYQ